MQWTVVIPAKALPTAKSRLAGASADVDAHVRLAAALRADTVAAALATPEVGHVLLVMDAATEPDIAETAAPRVTVLVQSAPGLNLAIGEGARLAAVRWPADGIAALLGDLPALRPDELATALRSAAEAERGYVPDAGGAGTTLLTARPGLALDPQFGADSAARHACVAVRLPAGPGLRRDVDTPDDLRDALDLGVGPATLAATRSATLAAGSAPAVPAVHLGGR